MRIFNVLGQGLGALLLLLFSASFARAQSAPSAKPNIVVMIADDLTYRDIGCWGNKDVHTPNLDKLASQGMRLTGCYTTSPVCSPTRQSLYTGLYPVRSGAYPNHSFVRPGVQSLPHYLKPLGYRVGLVGKRHFGPAASYPFEYPAEPGGVINGDDEGGGAERTLDYDAAERFVRRDPKQPYCLVVAPHEPHSPWTLGDQSAYKPEALTLPPYLVDTPVTRRALAHYYAEVTYLDEQVGRVMLAVERSGQADNTLFVFLSEQGSSMPHGKWTLYDVGIRAAAIARWPARIPAGSVNPALCQYIDFVPTFVEMAGGTPPPSPAKIDGRSILKLLVGGAPADPGRPYVYAEETSRGIFSGPPAYAIRAVADRKWKYIRNLNSDAAFQNTEIKTPLFKSWERKGQNDPFAREQAARYVRRPAVELYDLQADPFEMTNVADQPTNKATIDRLDAALTAWMKQQGDEGVKTEMEAKQHQAHGPGTPNE